MSLCLHVFLVLFFSLSLVVLSNSALFYFILLLFRYVSFLSRDRKAVDSEGMAGRFKGEETLMKIY